MGKFNVMFRDYGREVSTVQFPGADLTAANIDGELAAMVALRTALADITLGNIIKLTRIASVSPQEDIPATDKNSQRETKWLCRYHDDTTFEKATLEIPCAKLSLLDGNESELDLSAGVGAAFKTAFEAYVLPPGGNTAVLDEVIHVGRNI